MFGSSLGFQEILVICVILIVVVGPERLPSMMKGVGKALRTMREASREIRTTVGIDEMLRDDVMRPPPPRPRPAPAATVARAALPASRPEVANAPPSAPPHASTDDAPTAIYKAPAEAAVAAAPASSGAAAPAAAPTPPDVKPS